MSVADPIRLNAINRPKYRGILHTWCFAASIPAGMVLALTAPTARSAFAGGVFAFCNTAMFGISALFHRTTFDDRGWYRFRRLDHMGIYLAIAGGYTPFAMLALDGWQQHLLLIAGWVGASLGIFFRFMPFEPPYGMMNGLFMTLGWLAVLTFPELWDNVGHGWLVLTAIGGVFYTVGAIILGLRRPDPWPQVFGYHEIWHLMVAAAATMHYFVVAFGLLPLAS